MDIHTTLREICAAFNAHDLDRIMSFFADDCVLQMPRGADPWGMRLEGAAAVRKALASRFAGLPDVHYGDDTHFADPAAETGISKWTLTGTARDGRRDRGPRLRLLHLPRRQGRPQGLLLEDRRAGLTHRLPHPPSRSAVLCPAPLV